MLTAPWILCQVRRAKLWIRWFLTGEKVNVYPWGLWEDYAFVSEYRENVIKWERMYGNLLLEFLKSRKAAQKMGKGQKSMNR